MTRSSVDLPLPFGPTIATISRSVTRSSRPSSATTRRPPISKLRRIPSTMMASSACDLLPPPAGVGRRVTHADRPKRAWSDHAPTDVSGRLDPFSHPDCHRRLPAKESTATWLCRFVGWLHDASPAADHR